MKKLILTSFLLTFISLAGFQTVFAANLYQFNDGKVYDQNGDQQWICFQDPNGKSDDDQCLDKDNNISTRGTLGIGRPVPAQIAIPQSTPTTTYVPVYVPTPLVSGSPSQNQTTNQSNHMEPAYSESEIFYNIMGNNASIVPALVQMKVVNGEPTITARFSLGRSFTPGTTGQPLYELQKNLTVVFNGQTIYQNGIGQTPNGERSYAEVNGLTPNDTYNYTVTYSESGREETVISKQLVTPAQ